MFRHQVAKRHRHGRLLGAGLIAFGLLISGAGAVSASERYASSPIQPCLKLITDAPAFAGCAVSSGAWTQGLMDAALANRSGGAPECEAVSPLEDPIGYQQCWMMRTNLGFAPLPGSPENPGTPRTAAPAPPSKPAPKATSKTKTTKAPTKKAINKPAKPAPKKSANKR